jgi:hypothetical protein
MTDADLFSGSSGSMDAAHPELEWSRGRFDQPHTIKINTVYELPFGEGRRWLTTGVGNQVLGGWRFAAIQSYSSGYPLGVTTNAAAEHLQRHQPSQRHRRRLAGADCGRRVQSAGRPLLEPGGLRAAGRGAGATRRGFNPDVRRPWNLNENVSLAKSIKASNSLDMDIRVEAFNVFNRVVWGAPNTDFSSNNFGLITSLANLPRQMQLGLKLYW